MSTAKFSRTFVSLLLLVLMSSSVILATIFYSVDKSVVINANLTRSTFYDPIWLYTTHSAVACTYISILFAIVQIFRYWKAPERYRYICMIIAVGISSTAGFLVKLIVHRPQPFEMITSIHALGPAGGWSFPSGHTSAAFALAGIFSLLFPKRTFLSCLLYIWAILVGLSRLYLGVHYPSDVISAVAISSAVSYLAFWALKRYIPKELAITGH